VDSFEPKVNSLLTRGEAMTHQTDEMVTPALRQCLGNLRTRWDNIHKLCEDRKKKLDGASAQVDQFQDELNRVIDWLTATEKTLGGLKPASRVIETVRSQIKDQEVNREG